MKLFKKRSHHHHSSERIIVSKGNTRFGSGGYTRLRDNLLYINSDGNHKVIQIESAMAKEGKTSVTCNLAVSLGITDKKVVIVDLDFRRPRVHRVFKMPKEGGIAEYMVGSVSREKVVRHTAYKNVDVVTRGGEIYNPAIILVSQKFKELIASLRAEYDFVLLDCAPILQVSDYIHISKVSDGALFIVAYAKTSKAQVQDAVKELSKNNVTILGAMFTMYDRKKDSRYGYGSYHKYYDSGYEDQADHALAALLPDMDEIDAAPEGEKDAK